MLKRKKTKSLTNQRPGLSSGRDDRTRTGDPYVPNVVRYQLRYIPKTTWRKRAVQLLKSGEYPLLLHCGCKVTSFFLNIEKFLRKNLLGFKKSTTFALAIKKTTVLNIATRYLSSGGRAMDWKSMCPWFNSKRYHFLLSFIPVLALCGAGFFCVSFKRKQPDNVCCQKHQSLLLIENPRQYSRSKKVRRSPHTSVAVVTACRLSHLTVSYNA